MEKLIEYMKSLYGIEISHVESEKIKALCADKAELTTLEAIEKTPIIRLKRFLSEVAPQYPTLGEVYETHKHIKRNKTIVDLIHLVERLQNPI